MIGETPQTETVPRSGETLEVRVARLEEQLKMETRLRESASRSDKAALDKAEKFITEKSAAHNNLLKQMGEKDATYVTKKELEDARDKLFSRIIAILTITTAVGAIVTIYTNYLIRTAGK